MQKQPLAVYHHIHNSIMLVWFITACLFICIAFAQNTCEVRTNMWRGGETGVCAKASVFQLRFLVSLAVGQKAGTCTVQRTLSQFVYTQKHGHINYVHVLCIDVTMTCQITYITSVESYLHMYTYIRMYTYVSKRFPTEVNQIPECTYKLHTHSKWYLHPINCS